MEENGPHFICNECSVEVPVEDVQRIVMGMESTEVTCPSCGKINHIDSFTAVCAFVCHCCGQGAAL
jgi:hypothetical protein